mmetsp:Transcript_14198/g.59395  ORF Transcript_14198/g.59395 Transcript_14198/m.59395 type:complete len:202 (-) Transcript_14198:613-1218(-)
MSSACRCSCDSTAVASAPTRARFWRRRTAAAVTPRARCDWWRTTRGATRRTRPRRRRLRACARAGRARGGTCRTPPSRCWRAPACSTATILTGPSPCIRCSGTPPSARTRRSARAADTSARRASGRGAHSGRSRLRARPTRRRTRSAALVAAPAQAAVEAAPGGRPESIPFVLRCMICNRLTYVRSVTWLSRSHPQLVATA